MRQEAWLGRCVLEDQSGDPSCFVTLTYAQNPGQLVYRDIQLFLKRLRKYLPESNIRFVCVGEYGEKTLRGHWHLIIWGMFPHPEFRNMPEELWPHGHSMVGPVTKGGIRYVVGYVLKPSVEGAPPKLFRMSLRPGIGLEEAERMGSYYGEEAKKAGGCSGWPEFFTVGKKRYPFNAGSLEAFKKGFKKVNPVEPEDKEPLVIPNWLQNRLGLMIQHNQTGGEDPHYHGEKKARTEHPSV